MITPLLESKPSDENNAGCVFRRLAEQIAHPRGADANEHLDEIGAGNTKERHTGFASHGSRQQCLASPRRADEQHALGQMAAQALIFFRMLEKLDNLDELVVKLSTINVVLPVSFITNLRVTQDIGEDRFT